MKSSPKHPNPSVSIPSPATRRGPSRAGRPGYDLYGEAVLIAKTEAEKDFLLDNYILAEPEEIYSKLAIEASLRSHVLSTIASSYANTQLTLMEFFSKTLYAFQRDVTDLEAVLERIVDFLMDEGMVEERNNFIIATSLGRRVAQLYIDPYSAVMLRDALRVANEKETVELSYLHAIALTGELGGLYLRRGDYNSLGEVYYEYEKYLLVDLKEIGPWDKESVLSELKMASFLESWVDERTDEEIREHLIQIRGIGHWTVDMFLIFALNRPNVLPLGDLGIIKGFITCGPVSGLMSVYKTAVAPSRERSD